MRKLCVRTNASITRLGSIAVLAILGLAATAAAQRTAYVTHFGGNVTTFSPGAAGELMPVDTISGVGNSLRGIAIAPDGRTAYVVDSDLATITAFSTGDDGRLLPLAPPLETDPDASVNAAAQCAPAVTRLVSPCPFGVAVTPRRLTLQGPAVPLAGCTPTTGEPPIPQCSPFWTSISPDGDGCS